MVTVIICFLLAGALAYSVLVLHPCPESEPPEDKPAATCMEVDHHDHQELDLQPGSGTPPTAVHPALLSRRDLAPLWHLYTTRMHPSLMRRTMSPALLAHAASQTTA